MIKICNDRSVFPNNIKVSNQYENDTRSIDFDLSGVQFTGNTYLVCKYQGQSTFYAPLLLDSNFSIPVETFLSAQAGAYTCVIVISTVTIDENYDFSSDNPLFVSNEFTLNVEQNFLTGTATAWQLTPAAQNYFDQLIALVEKVQEDLNSGAFNGNGIQSITKIGSEGLVDTYQILFTDGSTFDFQVTNGATPTITIQDGVWFVNGVSTGVSAIGQKGDKGDPGVGIVSIEKTSTSGNVDTYTITFTNQTTSTFTVTNGTDGVTPNIQIGTVTTLEPGQQATATITGTPENPLLNLGIPQGQKGEGASDNIIYKDVAKQLNPNITDSFQRTMWNLKLYGQSTQGADPSPTNPQAITAISEFEGAPTGGNLFSMDFINLSSSSDYNVLDVLDKTETGYKAYRSGGNTNNQAKIIINDNSLVLENGKTYFLTIKNPKAKLSTGEIVDLSDTQVGLSTEVSLIKNNSSYTPNNNLKALNINVVYNAKSIEYVTFDYIQLEVGTTATPYTPYQSQPFTYTPTNPMYSTQDGSIADYVDVEKGVEVYNMKKYVVTGNEEFLQDYESQSGYYGRYFNLKNGNGQYTDKVFCNYLPYVTYLWNIASIGFSQNAKNQVHLKFDNETLGITDDTPLAEKQTAFANYLKQLYTSDNPLYVVVVVTPTETPIPQEQLAILKALYTYTGVTNFLCNAPVSFTYERSLQIVINNLENAINQTNANILLGGTL